MTPARNSAELRVLVVAPIGADAGNIAAAVRHAGLAAVVCPNLSVVALELPHGCGAILLTEEALNYERHTDLSRALAAEPKWSLVPIVLIVSGGKTPSFVESVAGAIGARSNLSLVERPVRVATLLSALRSALNGRLQQYEVRDLLRERDDLLASLERKVEERTAKLKELNTELEAFSYSVSHDLRAPLRSMENFARVLWEEYAANLPPEGRYFAERIMKNAQKMDQLLVDVLTVSRISRSELNLGPIDLDRLLDEVLDEYPDLAAAHRHIVAERPLGTVVADHSSLVQCFSNLLQNALKFVPKNRVPQVRVRSESRSDAIRIAVSDNGIGIDPKAHARIFGMFERAGPVDVPGTGIGLAIVKKAVERMGGTLGVESALGAGATFWIELPKPKP